MYKLSISKPVKGLKCGNNVGMSRGAGNSAGKCNLNLLELKMNPWLLAEEVGEMGCVVVRESDGLMILEVCCGSPIRRNSVLEELRVR